MDKAKLSAYQWLVGSNLVACYLLDIAASEIVGVTVSLWVYTTIAIPVLVVLFCIDDRRLTTRWHAAAAGLVVMLVAIQSTPHTPRKAFIQRLETVELGDGLQDVESKMRGYNNWAYSEGKVICDRVARENLAKDLSSPRAARMLAEVNAQWYDIVAYRYPLTYTGGDNDRAVIYLANGVVVYAEFVPE